MGFLSNFKDNPKSSIILNAIVRMAKWLGVPTIAEGVDDAGEVGFLRSIGCDFIQGFYYSSPITESALYEKIKSNNIVERKDIISFEQGDIAQILGGNYLVSKILNSMNSACAITEYNMHSLEIIRVNVEYEKVFKINSTYSLNYTNVFDLVHPDDLSIVKNMCDILVKTNVPRKITFRRRIINEEERENRGMDYYTVEANAFILFSNDSRHIICFSMNDVTEKYLYKSQLDETSHQLEVLFENSPCAIVLRKKTKTMKLF